LRYQIILGSEQRQLTTTFPKQVFSPIGGNHDMKTQNDDGFGEWLPIDQLKERGLPVTEGLIDAVMKIAGERTAIQRKMKEALLQGDDERALQFARQLVGIAPKPDQHKRT
jgi:hypothetical protein